MSDLRELYQTTILDHNRRPRNFRRIEGPARHADGYNPLCGDKVSVQVAIEDERVKDVAFQGAGCAISTASASLMTEAVKGRSLAEALELFRRFHELSTSEPKDDAGGEKLGKLAVFSGVREFPVRVKCATLAWHTLRAAIEQRADTVKTE